MAKQGYSRSNAEDKMKKGVGAVMEGKVEYPSILQLDEGDLKDVKDWKVGETYTVTLKIKEISSTTNEKYPGDSDAGEVHAEFQVMDAEVESPEEDKAEGKEEA